MPSAETHAPVFHQNRYAQELDRLVFEGCRWLDIGAGKKLHHGWLAPSSDALAARPAVLAGCDMHPNVLENTLLHDARIADAAALPWEDESFDIVSANMVLEHLNDPESVFAEVHRVLAPGGAFVFVTPNRLHPVIRAASLLAPMRVRRWYGILAERRLESNVFPTLYRANTVADLLRMTSRVGLRPERCEAFANSVPILRLWPFSSLESRLNELASRHDRIRRHGADLIGVFRRPE